MKWAVAVLALAGLLAAGTTKKVRCATHVSPCYNTGEFKNVNGFALHKYQCPCGDTYWVSDADDVVNRIRD
jgi:hypothetical protein